MDHDKLVYIRTDGNAEIASGHLMRCITIAEAVIKRGGEVCFIVSDAQSEKELLQRLDGKQIQKSISIKVLSTDYRNLEEEIPVLKQILSTGQSPVLLVDSYFVTSGYFLELKSVAKVYYLDDLQLFDYPVDGVINYDVQVNSAFYQTADEKYLEGKYAPLREQFQNCNYEVREVAKNLFLTTGGTDPKNFCEEFLRYFLVQEEAKDWKVHLIVGSMFTNKLILQEIAETSQRVVLYENVDHMAEVMGTCDLAISAGGTTLFELCAVGVPTLSISISENQIPCNEAFSQAGVISYEGNVSAESAHAEDLKHRLYAKVMELGSNLSKRQQMSLRQKEAVDGRGADRIAALLLCQ